MTEEAKHLRARIFGYGMRKLWGAAENVAAAGAAGGDPGLLLQIEAERSLDPDDEPEAAGAAQHVRQIGRDGAVHHTHWRHGMAAPFQAFASAETGGAALLLFAIVAALVWTNLPWHRSYATFWSNTISVDLAGHIVRTDLRGFVNDGLMTLFFLVVGLEGKRELDLGELRDRSRLAVPVIAGMAGICASVLIYVIFTSGSGGSGGWGISVSTDTALALGSLSLVTAGRGSRLRVFLLTLLVIDDLVSLFVITIFYPTKIHVPALITAVVLFAILMGLREYGRRHRDDQTCGAALFALSVLMGCGLWLALFEAGLDPVITGLIIGLLTSAYVPRRTDLERGSELTRSFRLDPSAESAHAASASVAGTISPNERLQYRLEPWTTRIIVPLFALANAGLHINGTVISDAVSSPITWGVVVAFVIGKPVGILTAAWATAKGAPRRGRLPVTWPELFGTASVAGVGFTVSLLIAGRAFTGPRLADAKLAILATVILAPVLSWFAFKTGRPQPDDLPQPAVAPLPDLATVIDPDQDHVLGSLNAPVTMTMYGSFGCVFSATAVGAARHVLSLFPGQVRFVYRHLPLDDVLPGAQMAAEATEAAAAQGEFWQMQEKLGQQRGTVSLSAVYRAARDIHLDLDRFFADLSSPTQATRVARDVASADASGVTGTPAFFMQEERYTGAYDSDSLRARVQQVIKADALATVEESATNLDPMNA